MTSRSLCVVFAVVVTGFACGGQSLVEGGNGAADAGGASPSDGAASAPVTGEDAASTAYDAGPLFIDDAGCTGPAFACGVPGSGVAIRVLRGRERDLLVPARSQRVRARRDVRVPQ
jgi:hypothetical protein